MFYVCVALSLCIVYLGKLYLNERLDSQNIKYHYNKEIKSLENSNKQIIAELKGYKEELATQTANNIVLKDELNKFKQ